MIAIDCHNHSNHSIDCDVSMRDMVESAYEKGVKVFAVTDHCDVNEYEKCSLATEIPASVEEINSLKGEFSLKGMKLLAGIELGQPLYDIKRSEEMLNINGIDFVLGSLHQLLNDEDFYFRDFTKMTADEINILIEKYYNELYAIAKLNIYDSMAHITYPYRYMKERACEVNYKKYDDIVADTYKLLINNCKAIELNTSSSFVDNAVDRNLIEYYLKLYRSVGGENITIGSDAHTPEGICGGMDLAEAMLVDIGYRHITIFENRKPRFIEI